MALVRAEFQRNNISLHIELSPDLPLVGADRIQLQQVMLNLIMNAVEAMSGTGHLQRNLTFSSAGDGPDGVLIAVKDSGAGFDWSAVDRHFEAFYTTKADGMGMGLAVSQTIIEAHGGRLWAIPNTPKGAIVQFRLPTVVEESNDRCR